MTGVIPFTGPFDVTKRPCKPLAYFSWGPVEECADVTLIPTARVRSVSTVKCKAILLDCMFSKLKGEFWRMAFTGR